MKRVMVLLCIVATFIGCKSAEPAVALPPAYTITVGRGGGFTGMYTFYDFQQDGKVLKKEELKAKGTELKSIEAKLVKTQMIVAVQNKYNDVALDNPGNFTNYLQVKGGTSMQLYRWTEGTQNVPEWITKMHLELWSLAE